MAEISVAAEVGRPTGSGAARRLRAADKVPGVVYGQGVDPMSVVVERRALRHALSGAAGLNAVITLNVGGRSHPTVVKELQRDPIRRAVTHVDFLVVNLDEEIEIEVPIVLVGEAKAVEDENGLVDPALNSLTVRCTPRLIPNEISIDITAMTIGDVIRVADLVLPEGATCPLDPDTAVVTAVGTRATIEPSATEAAPEGEAAGGESSE